MRSWRQLSRSVCSSLLWVVIKMVFMKHHGRGFWIKNVPLRGLKRAVSSAPKSPISLLPEPVNSSMSLNLTVTGGCCVLVVTYWLTFFSVEGLPWAGAACRTILSSLRWVMMVKFTHGHPGNILHWGDIYTNTLMYIFNWVIIYWP